MEANFLNRKLDPKQFQEYCLSREVLQDPTDLWNGEEGILAGDALSNCSNSLLPIPSGGVEQVEQIEQGVHGVHSVHLLAIGKTGCMHISDGPNSGISQQVSWQPHQQDAVLARDPFVSHHCANIAGNWLVLFTAGSLELVPLAAAGKDRFQASLPPEVQELGRVLAVGLAGDPRQVIHVLSLFCKELRGPDSARPLYRLTLATLYAEPGDPASCKQVFELSGFAPPLAAVISADCCMILANGIYYKAATGATGLPSADSMHTLGDSRDEGEDADEELRSFMEARGVALPRLASGADSVAAYLTQLDLIPTKGVRQTHRNLGLAAAAGFELEGASIGDLSLGVVLCTPSGHGAVCHCAAVPGGGGGAKSIQVTHVDTFPGLALCCRVPGFAYLAMAEDYAWAAVGRWQGEAVEIFQHPRGARTSATQGLVLPAPLCGLCVRRGQLYAFHGQRLQRFRLAQVSIGKGSASDPSWDGAAPVTTEVDWGCDREA